MTIAIPFPLPNRGYAQNSKVKINLDYIVAQFNSFNTGTATWDNVSVGTAGSLTGTVTFYNSSNSNYVTLQAGATSSSYTLTWPTALPASSGVLQSNASGTLSWATTITGQFIFNAGTAGTPSIRAADNTDTGLYYATTGSALALSYDGSRFFGKETGGVFLEGIPNYTGSSLIYSVGGYLAELPNSQAAEGIVSVASSQTPKVKKFLGTSNQVTVTSNTNDFTLSTPQDLDTSANFQVSSVRTGDGTSAANAVRVGAANTGLYRSGSDLVVAVGGSIAAYFAATSFNFQATGDVCGSTITVGTGNAVTFASGASADYTLTWPANDGDANQVLTTNGSGTLSWTDVTAIGGANTALSNLASVAINTTLVSDTNNTDDLGTSSIRWKTAYLATSLDISATSNQIVLGTTRTVTLTAPTPATASRTITFPDLSGSYDVVGTIGSQTITGTKTFTSSSGTGFGNSSAPSASTLGGIDIWSGGLSIVIGADTNASTRTNTTNKSGRITCAHYTNTEEPVSIATLTSTTSASTLILGGGTGLANAATAVQINTASGTTTTDGTQRFLIDTNGNVVIGVAQLATNASDGFLYLPTCAGAPTGTPTAYSNRRAVVWDATNFKLYVYDGAWKSVALT